MDALNTSMVQKFRKKPVVIGNESEGSINLL